MILYSLHIRESHHRRPGFQNNQDRLRSSLIQNIQSRLVGKLHDQHDHGIVPYDLLKSWLKCFYKFVHWFACFYWKLLLLQQKMKKIINFKKNWHILPLYYQLFLIDFEKYCSINIKMFPSFPLFSATSSLVYSLTTFFRFLIPRLLPLNFFSAT